MSQKILNLLRHERNLRKRKRKKISAKMRKTVFKFKGDSCTYCGEKGIRALDHIIPVARGGKNTFDNLVPCCDSCNSRKGYSVTTEWREQCATL